MPTLVTHQAGVLTLDAPVPVVDRAAQTAAHRREVMQALEQLMASGVGAGRRADCDGGHRAIRQDLSDTSFLAP